MSRFLPSCDSAYHRDRSPPRGPRALLDASWGPALGPAGTPGFGRGRGPRGDYREYRDRRSSPPQPRDRSTVRGRGRGDWAYSRAWSGHERDERRKDREREADLYKRDRQADHRPFSASPRASTAQEHSRRPELSRHRIPDGAASPPHAPQGIPLGPAARPLPPIVPLPSARRASSPPRPATHHQSNTNNSHPQPVFAPRSVPTGPRAHKSSQTPNAPRPDRGDRGPERGIAQEQREASLAEGATSRPSSSTSSQALASRNTADHGTLGGKRDIIPIAAPKGPKADRKPEWTAPRGTPTRPHQWVRPGFQHQARSSLIPAKRNARGDERANRHSLIPEEALSSTLSLDMSEAHGHSQQSQQSQLPPLEGEELSQTVGLEAASKGLSPAPSLHENGFSSLVPSKVEPKLMIVPSAPIFEQKTTTPQATEHVKDMAADATFAESKFEELAANLIQSEKSTMAIKHAAENMPPHITLLSEPARTPNEPTPSQNGMAAIAQSPEPSSPKHDVPDEIVPNPFPESESSDKRHPSASFTPAPSPNAEGKQPAAQIHLPRREKGLNCRDASTISNLPFVAKLPLEDLDCIKDTLLNHEKNEDIFLTLLVQQKQVLENQRLAEKSEYKSNYITWRKERILDDERTVAARVAAETRRGKKYSSEFDIEQVIKESEITAEEDRAKLNSGVGWGNYKKEATIPEMVQDDFSNPKAYVFQDQEHWVAGHLAHETLEFFHQKRNFTEEEQAQFLSKYIQFPKRFDKIAEELPGRTISDCIAYYYQTKGEKKYKDRITKSLRGKKGRRTDQAMMAKPKSNALMSNALVNPDREDAEEEQAFQKAQRASNTFATSSETIAVTETGRPRRAAAPIFGEPATEADSSLSNIPSTKKNFNSFKIDFAAESISERPSKRAKAASTRGRGPGRGKIATTAAPVVLAREPDKFGMEKEREIEKEREFEREMESKREESEREKEKETAEENFQVARLPSFQIAPAAVPLVAQNLIESSKPLPPDTGSQPSYPDILEGPRFGQQTRQIQTTSSYWSVPEVQDFPRLLSHFGTNWSNIANHMGSKTHIMVKNYYARQLEGGASDLEEIARRADAKIARGDMAGQPPTMTPLPKKRYEAHATVPSQYLAPNNTESAVLSTNVHSSTTYFDYIAADAAPFTTPACPLSSSLHPVITITIWFECTAPKYEQTGTIAGFVNRRERSTPLVPFISIGYSCTSPDSTTEGSS
ncbi:MAG: hypothetical protein M1829_005796 [Trizodia sp. TS-e1964]|nr:MAG: hypothetical protein M1829_005796 [Trizodia sp. TS-e1964]